jgi:hypothetical protein
MNKKAMDLPTENTVSTNLRHYVTQAYCSRVILISIKTVKMRALLVLRV